VVVRPDQAVKTFFMNTNGGMRICVGTGGVTGFHGHFIVVDDPLDPKESNSELKINTANTWMSETLSQRKVDKRITPTILVMQRLHQDDCTQNMINRSLDGKIKQICLPADTDYEIKPPELIEYYVNGLMDSVRLSAEVLEENKANLGEYGYASQFGQSPIPRGGGMFKTDRIKIDIPEKDKWQYKVRYWDKAGSVGKGCFTVGVLMGKDRKGVFWILDVIRGQWGSDQRESIIKQAAEIDGRKIVVGVEQEPGSGGKESAENTVRNLAGWRVRVDRPTGDKALRADPFSVQVNNGNVSMVQADWNHDYFGELSYFPFSKYMDQVDATSGAFNMLVTGKRRVGGFKKR